MSSACNLLLSVNIRARDCCVFCWDLSLFEMLGMVKVPGILHEGRLIQLSLMKTFKGEPSQVQCQLLSRALSTPGRCNSLLSKSFMPMTFFCTSLSCRKRRSSKRPVIRSTSESFCFLHLSSHQNFSFELGVHDLHEAFRSLGMQSLKMHSCTPDR